MAQIRFSEVLGRLKSHYGVLKAPKLAGAWEMILWENVAYLADDKRRLRAFQTLKKRTGFRPERILAASGDALLEVTQHGILAEQFAEKLRKCAKIALEEFDGDVNAVLKWPVAKAMKALKKFPGIGEPGAEKLLLFMRAGPVLALDSNGLRVLLRLGYGEEKKNYAATYKLVQQAVEDELDEDYSWLIQAHLLLRRHGQELCRRTKPLCDQCPLAVKCAYYQGGDGCHS